MMTRKAIYLDYNATTPCAPEVVDAMSTFFANDFANPSSPHLLGRMTARAVSEARSQLASSITAEPGDVFFTSGATESNNILLLGDLGRRTGRQRIVVSAIEHSSVLAPCQWLSTQGYEVVHLPVTRDGVVDLAAAEDLIDTRTLLVCVQGANNEIGTLQPIRAIAEMSHRRGAIIHCDASQMLGKVPVSVSEMDVDSAAFSAHKAYGPKGVGAIFVRASLRDWLTPVYHGGGQEFGIRPGTLNVPGIVGFGVASVSAAGNVEQDRSRVSAFRDSLERGILCRCPQALAVGSAAARIPNTSNICFRAISADVLLAQLPLICAGIGSACSSGSVTPSHVLLACGLTRDEARSAVRFSLGRWTTEGEILAVIEQVTEAVERIRTTSCV